VAEDYLGDGDAEFTEKASESTEDSIEPGLKERDEYNGSAFESKDE